MKKSNLKKSRLLSLLMVFVMLFTMIPSMAFASADASYPFTEIATDAGAVIGIEDKGTVDYTGYSTYYGVPYYHVTIPEEATEVYVTHPSSEDPFADVSSGSAYGYVAETGGWTGSGASFDFESVDDGYKITLPLSVMVDTDGDWTTDTEGSFVADEEGNVGYAVAVERSGDNEKAYSPICFFTFEYGEAEAEEPEKPFLSIKIDGIEVPSGNILYKGIFKLGDYADDEQQETEDYYDYVHNVPYYHVTVPCGTEYVDVTYPATANIMNSGSNAYGYKTDLTVDAVSSATVRGNTFKDAYTKNGDGTQTVKTPVKGYTFDVDGNGHANTLEEDGGSYDAVCLFTFAYDGLNHIYVDGVCSCGAEAPAESVIPEGAPFTDLSTDTGAVIGIEDKGTVDYTGYSEYSDVPYYHVTIPEGATKVYVTHPSSEYPFADVDKKSAYGYVAETEGWTGSGASFDFEPVDDGYKITLPLSVMVDTDGDWTPDTEGSFVADEEGNVGYAVAVERSGDNEKAYSPICFFTFEYEAGECKHENGDYEVTKEATCYEEGIRTFVCDCGYVGASVPISKADHVYGEPETVPATCYSKGTITRTCTATGCTDAAVGHTVVEEIEKIPHTYGDPVTVEATCYREGTVTETCTVAGCPDAAEGHTKVISTSPRTDHNYGKPVTVEATCTADGSKTYTCQYEGCPADAEGHTKVETISASGHTYGDDKTCDACGFIDYTPAQDENNVYKITTTQELFWFALEVKGGNNAISGKLMNDISVPASLVMHSGKEAVTVSWPGIGISGAKFRGDFDGQNHTITLNGSTWGVFGYVQGTSENYVQIKNIITAGTVSNTAIVHDALYLKIENCINRAAVGGNGTNSAIAGIVGSASAPFYPKYPDGVYITACANEGTVTGSSEVAGIIGKTNGTNVIIAKTYNSGDVKGDSCVGGIIGYVQGYPNASTITNCYNTGKIDGTSKTGGIIGHAYNSVKVTNCYNAGEATYAIIGEFYDNTAIITNTFYRGDLCTYSVPDKVYNGGNFYTGSRGTSVTASEMSGLSTQGDSVAQKLGDAFIDSCPSPLFAGQTPVKHNKEDGYCTVCQPNGNEAETYVVTKSTGDGYTIAGADTYQKGADYTFTLNIAEYYDMGDNFAVYVDGKVILPDEDGTYLVANPNGPFYITVVGIIKQPDEVKIILPADGNGYRIIPCEGYESNKVNTKSENPIYKFTVNFIDGFTAGEDFALYANGIKLAGPDANGVYTINNIKKAQTIVAKGVVVDKDGLASVTVNFDITVGTTDFYESEAGKVIMMNIQEEIPYFDLNLYNLEKYYYNPDCYSFTYDESGNKTGIKQVAGTRELAYNNVTAMHAYIYLTEVYHLGYDKTDAGTGKAYTVNPDAFKKAVSWTQGVGSSFMDLWGMGTNLNYHVNYVYPLGLPEWGSTSDQIKLNDGDRISVHMIKGSASGSGFGLFAINDNNNVYDRTEGRDAITVKQGETFKITHYLATQGSNYSTAFITSPNTKLYWIEAENVVTSVIGREDEGGWYTEGFGSFAEGTFKTDANGEIEIDTTGINPGVYYIGALGANHAGTGFAGAGTEFGPAYFVLTVEESEALVAAKNEAKDIIDKYLKDKEGDYRDAEKAELESIKYLCMTDIKNAATIAEVEEIVAAAKIAMDAIKTDAELDAEEAAEAAAALANAKTEAKANLAAYKNAADYREAQQTELAEAIEAGNAAIEAAETEEAVAAALEAAKTAMDAIKTDAQLKEEENKKPSGGIVNDYVPTPSTPKDEVTNNTGSTESAPSTEVAVSGDKTTVKTENGEAKAETVIDKSSADKIVDNAAENKSEEIVLQISADNTKGAAKVEVKIETSTVKDIVSNTEAALTVKTENGSVSLDQETLKTVVSEAEGTSVTLEITEVKAPTEVQKEVAGESGHVIQLVIKSGDKIISSFNEGKATVTVEIPSKLHGKKVAAIHIGDDGKIEHLKGETVTEGGKAHYRFDTPHFSTFALVDAEEIGLTTMTAEEVQALAADLSFTARSVKTAKGIKVTLKMDDADKAIIEALEAEGCTVKYKFYRSTKKASKYQAKLTTKKTTYTNTSGKAGTKYYYKAIALVYNAEGELIAKTALKQCKYATRTWNK